MRGRATPALRNGFARDRPRVSDQQRWRHLGEVVVQARRGRQPRVSGQAGATIAVRLAIQAVTSSLVAARVSASRKRQMAFQAVS